jgi:hypothetical protein
LGINRQIDHMNISRVLRPFFCIVAALAAGQALGQVNQQKIKEMMVGKRWGLSLYITQSPLRNDTLFRTRNCAEEFLELFPDGSFESPDLNKLGRWEVLNDSTVLFRGSGGARLRQVVVNYLAADSLVTTDWGLSGKRGRDAFIETFRACQLTDKNFFDTRESYTITDTWGLNLGFQQFRASFAEIGIGRGVFGRKGRVVMPMLNVELAPWQGVYGLAPTVMVEDRIFAYGLALAGYTDEGKTFLRLRPMAGFTLKRLFGAAGYTAQLFYAYNLSLGDTPNDRLNLHSVNLRLHLPFSRRTRTGKFSPDEEYER